MTGVRLGGLVLRLARTHLAPAHDEPEDHGEQHEKQPLRGGGVVGVGVEDRLWW